MAPKASNKMELSEEIPWSVVIIIVIGTFMAILDSSIVNVALPKMMAVFGANTDTIAWVVTAYMLTLGVVMPLSGYLGDTFGYKRCYFTALALFVTGSFLCGFAWSMDSLIAARVIQAMGGGIVTPLGMAIIYKTCPRDRIGEMTRCLGHLRDGGAGYRPDSRRIYRAIPRLANDLLSQRADRIDQPLPNLYKSRGIGIDQGEAL